MAEYRLALLTDERGTEPFVNAQSGGQLPERSGQHLGAVERRDSWELPVSPALRLLTTSTNVRYVMGLARRP